jgi:hypothetical protein
VEIPDDDELAIAKKKKNNEGKLHTQTSSLAETL